MKIKLLYQQQVNAENLRKQEESLKKTRGTKERYEDQLLYQQQVNRKNLRKREESLKKTRGTKGRKLKIDDFEYTKACWEVAKIKGLSGRELTNLTLDQQMTTCAFVEGVLTKERMLIRDNIVMKNYRRPVLVKL
ncbi:hypothetical protein Anas_07362 [Armadillidium nasatum]|uniref:Uncharacterized protein n=1 Tax=Armadillidium nasatum TaxID=96803 RepID=A0A5N5TF77_9CRUS|nr:hypothetical protein Anas_07362 [Armadillidium nasatum]